MRESLEEEVGKLKETLAAIERWGQAKKELRDQDVELLLEKMGLTKKKIDEYMAFEVIVIMLPKLTYKQVDPDFKRWLSPKLKFVQSLQEDEIYLTGYNNEKEKIQFGGGIEFGIKMDMEFDRFIFKK